MTTEPVRILGLINAAVVATIALLGLFLAPATVAVVGAFATAWIAVATEIARSRVTPVKEKK